jgi:hypothetical protein
MASLILLDGRGRNVILTRSLVANKGLRRRRWLRWRL